MTEPKRKPGRAFRQMLDDEFRTSAERQELVDDVETTVAVAHLMSTLEEIRAKQGLSKAEIARQMQRHAPTVVRLLSQDHGNPTVKTLIQLLGAMGLRATLVIEPAPKVRRHAQGTGPSARNVLSVKARIPATATA